MKVLALFVALFFVACTTTDSVDTEQGGSVFALSDVDRPPRPIKPSTPEYPKQLRDQKVAGSVLIEYIIDEKGSCGSIKIVRSSVKEFEAAAIKAIRSSKYSPALKSGLPVRVRVRQELTWKP